MKPVVDDLFGSIPIFLLALALMPAISFANSAPPPPSQVTVHLVSNGTNETGISQIVYHCTPSIGTDVAEKQNISLTCSAGTCTNDPYYSGSPCAYFPAGYFSYNYRGQNKSSERFNATKSYQRYYEYQLDVQDGELSLISASGGSSPNGFLCCPVLFVFAAVAGFIASKRG